MSHTRAEAEFAAAVDYVNNFKGLFDLKTQRALFGLEQQATVGDYTGRSHKAPKTEEERLLSTWSLFGGMTKHRAKENFISLVRQQNKNFNPILRAETHPNLRGSRLPAQRRYRPVSKTQPNRNLLLNMSPPPPPPLTPSTLKTKPVESLPDLKNKANRDITPPPSRDTNKLSFNQLATQHDNNLRGSTLSVEAVAKNERMAKRLGYNEASHSGIFTEQDEKEMSGTVLDTAMVSEGYTDMEDYLKEEDFETPAPQPKPMRLRSLKEQYGQPQPYEEGEIDEPGTPQTPVSPMFRKPHEPALHRRTDDGVSSTLKKKLLKVAHKRSSLYSQEVLDRPHKKESFGSANSVPEQELQNLLQLSSNNLLSNTHDYEEQYESPVSPELSLEEELETELAHTIGPPPGMPPRSPVAKNLLAKRNQRLRRMSSEEMMSVENETRLSRIPYQKLTPANIRKVVRNRMQKHPRKSANSFSAQSELLSQNSEPEESREDVRRFKRALANFLLEFEPDRVDYFLQKMVKYKSKLGLYKLNENLVSKYGRGLTGVDDLIMKGESMGIEEQAHGFRVGRLKQRHTLTEHDSKLLHLYFAKHDHRYVNDESLVRIVDWAGKHGIGSFNRKLKKKYKEDLDEFIYHTAKLKAEITEFYAIVDKTKLQNGLENLLTWGVLNGRDKLNDKLNTKYGVNLDSETKEIQAFRLTASMI